MWRLAVSILVTEKVHIAASEARESDHNSEEKVKGLRPKPTAGDCLQKMTWEF